MTTFRVDSEDFRQFIDWLIENDLIEDKWARIRCVYETPEKFQEKYEAFQASTYEPEVRSYKCKTCGAIVTEADVEDFEAAKQCGECRKCYYHPDNWGNE